MKDYVFEFEGWNSNDEDSRKIKVTIVSDSAINAGKTIMDMMVNREINPKTTPELIMIGDISVVCNLN